MATLAAAIKGIEGDPDKQTYAVGCVKCGDKLKFFVAKNSSDEKSISEKAFTQIKNSNPPVLQDGDELYEAWGMCHAEENVLQAIRDPKNGCSNTEKAWIGTSRDACIGCKGFAGKNNASIRSAGEKTGSTASENPGCRGTTEDWKKATDKKDPKGESSKRN